MAMKDGIVGDFLMWSFLGALAVLVVMNASGFSTAIGSASAPLEFETSLIATGGKAAGTTSSIKAT